METAAESLADAASVPLLVCPRTHRWLRRCTQAQAEAVGREVYRNRHGARLGADKTGAPDAERQVLLRDDGAYFYPIVDGVPVLLGPEAYTHGAPIPSTSLPQYVEAYAEMPVYDRVAHERSDPHQQSHQRAWLKAASQLSARDRTRFPEPASTWCDQLYEYSAQLAAYRRLAPLGGKRLMQLGGTGIHALKFLLGGAAEAWLVTPMLGEAAFSNVLARELGLLDRFHAVVAIGEELPFADASFDGIYSSSCLHHMITSQAARSAARVLVPGGVFAAIDPWLAPMHRMGTALVGKRERGVHCHPLDAERFQAFRQAFAGATCERFGALFRYPLLGLQKFGLNIDDARVRSLMKLDESLCRVLPVLRHLCSAALVTARREGGFPTVSPTAGTQACRGEPADQGAAA